MTTEQPGASPALSDQLGPLPKREGLSMTERELLTRAAEAAGLRIEYWAQEDYPVVGVGEAQHGWNPLKFNSDALALAVRMEMDVFVRAGRWTEAVAPMGEPYKAMHGVHGDAETATRFAITMAALGKPTGNPADWSGRMRAKLDKLRQYDEAETPMDGKTPNVGGEARLAAHQPLHTTTATPQGVASTDQLGGRTEEHADG